MATKSFKDLPKNTQPQTVEDLQKALAAAQAALSGKNTQPPASAAGAEADEPVVIETAKGAPIDVPPVSPVQPAPMPQIPAGTTGAAVSNPADFLALMSGASQTDAMNALLAAAETDSSGGKLLFPILTQSPGTAAGAGAFMAIQTKNTEFAQIDLPEGKKPFTAIYIAYRYFGTAWPKGYDPKAKEHPKPVFNVAVPMANGQLAAQLMLAGKAGQFSRDRKAFDIDNGGPGHVKPAIEFLLFEPDIGLFVFRTCAHYNSAKDARDQLIACAEQDANGNLQLKPFLAEFSPQTHEQPRPGKDSIVHHYPKIVKIAGTDARVGPMAQAYKQFLANAAPEVRERTKEWFDGADAPVTSLATNAIDAAAAMG